MSKKKPNFSYFDKTHIVMPNRNPVSITGRLKNKLINRKKECRCRTIPLELVNSVVAQTRPLFTDIIFPSARPSEMTFEVKPRDGVDATSLVSDVDVNKLAPGLTFN